MMRNSSDNEGVASDLFVTTRPAAGPGAPRRARSPRWLAWLIVAAAGILAWILFMLAAVLQHEYLVLLFPAGWCVHVAVRQFRQITRGRANA